MADIREIVYCGHKGEITVWFDDTDISTDYFHMATLRQKDAIEWIKKDGASEIYADVSNSQIRHARKALECFKRIEKATGKKIILKPQSWQYEGHYETVEAARSALEGIRGLYEAIGRKATIYKVGSFGVPGYVIAADRVTFRDWEVVRETAEAAELPEEAKQILDKVVPEVVEKVEEKVRAMAERVYGKVVL